MIESLSYFGVTSPSAEAWLDFGPNILGLEVAGRGPDGALRLSADDAAQRGRHTNDWMTSFYLRSPSGFEIEYGWGRTPDRGRSQLAVGLLRRAEHLGPQAAGQAAHARRHSPVPTREELAMTRAT